MCSNVYTLNYHLSQWTVRDKNGLFQVIKRKKIFVLFRVKKLYEFLFFSLSLEVLALHSSSPALQVRRTCCMEMWVRVAFAESKASAAADFANMLWVNCIALPALPNGPLLFQERLKLFYVTMVYIFSEWQFLKSDLEDFQWGLNFSCFLFPFVLWNRNILNTLFIWLFKLWDTGLCKWNLKSSKIVGFLFPFQTTCVRTPEQVWNLGVKFLWVSSSLHDSFFSSSGVFVV